MAKTVQKKKGGAPKGNKFAVGNKGGRPTSYRPEYVEQARKLCQIGATDVEMSQFFGVSLSTFFLWRAANQEFSDAIIAGKALADERMKRSLYQRGIGYNLPVVKIEERLLGKGKNAKLAIVKRTTSAEHIPGDVGAQKMWLCNRVSKEWRDKIEHTHEPVREITPAEALENLVSILVRNGVQIALPPPTIEGDSEEQETEAQT
jgi:hypothetical protein